VSHRCDPKIVNGVGTGPVTERRVLLMTLGAINADEAAVGAVFTEIEGCSPCWASLMSGLAGAAAELIRESVNEPVMAIELKLAAVEAAIAREAEESGG
jgi:hypothetical protein